MAAEKITLARARTMSGATQFNDDDLKRLAAFGREKYGLGLRVPESLHKYCAGLIKAEADKQMFATGKPYLDCWRFVTAQEGFRHLLFLSVAEIVDDRYADIQFTETSA